MTHISHRFAGLVCAVWLTASASALAPALGQAWEAAPANTDIQIVASDWRVTCRPMAATFGLICEGARQ